MPPVSARLSLVAPTPSTTPYIVVGGGRVCEGEGVVGLAPPPPAACLGEWEEMLRFTNHPPASPFEGDIPSPRCEAKRGMESWRTSAPARAWCTAGPPCCCSRRLASEWATGSIICHRLVNLARARQRSPAAGAWLTWRSREREGWAGHLLLTERSCTHARNALKYVQSAIRPMRQTVRYVTHCGPCVERCVHAWKGGASCYLSC